MRCQWGWLSSFFPLFCHWWPWPLTLTFELGRDFCTLHLTAKFHHPTFSRSEGIMRTNKHTNIQTPMKTSTALRCATPVGNYSCAKTMIKAHRPTVVVLQTKSNVPIASSVMCNMINGNCHDTVGRLLNYLVVSCRLLLCWNSGVLSMSLYIARCRYRLSQCSVQETHQEIR